MRLISFNATNTRGSVLDFPLEDTSGGFVVQGIEGLGPVKANIVSSSFADADGEQYHSSRREARDIKISLGLEPDYGTQSVKELRDQLYSFFMPKTKVVLGFHLFDKFASGLPDETLDVQIEGYVETTEPNIFAKEPTIDISIHCPDPDFIIPASTVLSGNTVSSLATSWNIPYEGSIETGITFKLNVNRSISAFSIQHTLPDQTVKNVDVTYDLLNGDVVEIDSNFGSKGVYLTRAGVKSSILYAQSPQSNWLELWPGDNNFQVVVAGAAIPFSVEYITKYGGL